GHHRYREEIIRPAELLLIPGRAAVYCVKGRAVLAHSPAVESVDEKRGNKSVPLRHGRLPVPFCAERSSEQEQHRCEKCPAYGLWAHGVRWNKSLVAYCGSDGTLAGYRYTESTHY